MGNTISEKTRALYNRKPPLLITNCGHKLGPMSLLTVSYIIIIIENKKARYLEL